MPVIVVDYDPGWPLKFRNLTAPVTDALGDMVQSVEHVGSTSVPGLCAKPIIDMDVVVAPSDVAPAIDALAPLGYRHRGDLGVAGREAFYSPASLPAHHLYLCPEDSLGLRNHLAVRDFLRADPEAVNQYAQLKRDLAERYPDDIESYIEGKSEFLLRILAQCGLGPDDRASILESNRKK